MPIKNGRTLLTSEEEVDLREALKLISKLLRKLERRKLHDIYGLNSQFTITQLKDRVKEIRWKFATLKRNQTIINARSNAREAGRNTNMR